MNRADERRAAANARAELAPLKKRIEASEREIEKLTQALQKLDLTLADPALYEREPERAQILLKDRGALAKALGEAEMLWLEVSEDYEQARLTQAGAISA
jgi:ATP-binding cassette subfamily F protein 3